MKKLMRLLLLAAILSALLCVGVLAAESEPVKGGIYGITGSVTLTPKDAGDKEIVSGSSDGVATNGYYANAVKFDVKAQNLTGNQQYLLLVLKGEAARVRALADRLISCRGVKHGTFSVTTTGQDLA